MMPLDYPRLIPTLARFDLVMTHLSFGRVFKPLQNNPFDLIKSDLVVAAIVELGRAGALMRRHLLGVFEQPAIEQIDGNAGCPEGVTAEPGDDPGLQGATYDHPPGVLAGHALAG
jgi:hypothetical protein